MIINELIKITPQRDLFTVAMECDVVFADYFTEAEMLKIGRIIRVKELAR